MRCVRAKRGELLMSQIERVWQANMEVCGADEVWRQLRWEGTTVARCTVERLMCSLGLRGVMRGKVVRTTISDSKAPCPRRVLRNISQKWTVPNRDWKAALTRFTIQFGDRISTS